jgi:CMP-N,N'-diacetyllegionaminic acid synthase
LNVVALITARGGSKGIPRKNLAPVAGKPLIAWTIAAALGAKCVSRVLVSTDDPEIAEVSRQCGAEVPFLRPAELAEDHSTSFDVAAHALRWLSEHDRDEPDYLLLLQPTSPLRTAADIDGAIALARERNADAVLAVCEASPHPYLARRVDERGQLSDFISLAQKPSRRQEYPAAYMLNAAIYLNRPASLLATRSFQPPGALAYVMPQERSLDVDSSWELRLVDLLLRDTHA